METLNVDNPTFEASSNPTPDSANVNPSPTDNTQDKRKDNKREKSEVWVHFTRDPSDQTIASCDYCTQKLKCPSKNGTTSLRNHLARCKKYPYNVDKKQKLLIFQSQSSVQDSGDSNWDYAKSLLPFLRGFYNSTLRISGSLYVTSNMYFHEVFGLGAMIRKKMKDEDESLRKMAAKMKQKYDKYWSNIDNINIYLFIGPILDPRHKLGYVSFIIRSSFDTEKAEELIDKIDRVLDGLFDHYSAMVGVVSENSESNSQVVDENEGMELDDDPAAFLNNQYKKQLEESSGFTGAKSEKDKYLDEQCEPLHSKFEILTWWKKNKARFPVMAAMARDILAIPASTVASESAFSTGGRVLDAFRSSLTPRIVEALICSQNWLRSKTFPLDIEEKLEELEALEADLKDLPEAFSTITVDD